MKYRTMIFIVTMSVLFIAIGAFNVFLLKNSLNDKVFRLGDDVDTIIVGDSHTMSSLDPEILGRAANISLNTENYFYTYYKLKHFLDRNPGIRNVVLGFSYHNLSKVYEEPPLFDDNNASISYEIYYLLLDKEGKELLKSTKKSYLLNFMKYDVGIPIRYYKNDLYLKRITGQKINKSDFVFYGNYYVSEKSNINKEEIGRKVDKYFYDNNVYGGISKTMVDYVEKIVILCRGKDIKIYLFNAPLYSYYRERVPKNAVMDYENTSKWIRSKYDISRIVDFAKYPLDSTYFGDGDHVNSKGARIVSKELRDIIRSESKSNGDDRSESIDSALDPIPDEPGLPRVLLIGDSISIGYTLPARKLLRGKANVHRPPENCEDTAAGLRKLEAWLETGKWDVIHFNFGLHDMKNIDDKGWYLLPKGRQVAPPIIYAKNLRELVRRLKRTGAKLIWCSTTPVPGGSAGRVKGVETEYNRVAEEIMREYNIPIDDLHAFAESRLAAIQIHGDVHFTREGYRQLAKQVAASIEQYLWNP